MKNIGIVGLIIMLSGCVEFVENQKAFEMDNARTNCVAYGFKENSEAMAQCVQREINQRREDFREFRKDDCKEK